MLVDLNVLDPLNMLLWAIVTLAAVVILELKLSATKRLGGSFSSKNSLNIGSDLGDVLIDHNRRLFFDVGLRLNVSDGRRSSNNFWFCLSNSRAISSGGYF